MSDLTVNIGIDHGTSNSSIAVMEKNGPRVIRSDGPNKVMPSAVFYDHRGREEIGRSAYESIFNLSEEGNGVTGYKLEIGQKKQYKFCRGTKTLTGPELGAKVIQSLLRVYQKDVQIPADAPLPKTCVITVPAKFDDSAREGTREAARRAGLLYYPLLKEPIAASLAYGFAAQDRRAQWLIFDLGGGTLDVSLVFVRNGKMTVPDEGQGGDPHLGGTTFDRYLMDHVITGLERSAKGYVLTGLRRDPRFEQARSRLIWAVEQAKIKLSRDSQATVLVPGILCSDDRGKPVEVDLTVTKEEYETLIKTDVLRAAHICKTVLDNNRLTPQDVDRLILIGGPTKTPLVRQVLSECLGIPLEDSIDPMTAVAEGAALYAGTCEIPDEIWKQIVALGGPRPTVSIDLQYEPSSTIPTAVVCGTVVGLTDPAPGLTVEIRRGDAWSSGQIPVTESGRFECEVMLQEQDRPLRNDFTTVLRDAQGQQLAAVEGPQIWHPYVSTGVLKAVGSLCVAVKGNATEVLIPKGSDLPAHQRKTFETTKLLRKGSTEDVLRIPIMESATNLLGLEDEHADCCYLVGTLTICGNDSRISCDLPEGSAVVVSLDMDESMELKATARVPLLDEDFEATLTSSAYGVTQDQVAKRFELLKNDISEARGLYERRPIDGVGEVFAAMDEMAAMESIAKDLQRAKDGDSRSLNRAYKRVLELAGTLNHIHKLQRNVRIEDRIELLEALVDGLARDELKVAKSDFASGTDNKATLTRVEEALDSLDDKIRLGPCQQICIDLRALAGRRVTPHQHELFDQAAALYDQLVKKVNEKGLSAVTDADLDRINAMRKDLADAYPELPDWRKPVIEIMNKEWVDWRNARFPDSDVRIQQSIIE